jgi:Cytochrome P450
MKRYIQFIMGLLVAGARATGTTGTDFRLLSRFMTLFTSTSASWILLFLGAHPQWRAKAMAEIEAMMRAYPLSTPPGSSSSLSGHLAAISLDVWESETPTLDAIIRETLRIAQPHIAMRRNLGPEVYINDKAIPTGAYVVYPFMDVHLDPELYPDPWKFNPERQEQLKTPLGFVGWGGGSCFLFHILILSLLMVLSFEFSSIHENQQAIPSV